MRRQMTGGPWTARLGLPETVVRGLEQGNDRGGQLANWPSQDRDSAEMGSCQQRAVAEIGRERGGGNIETTQWDNIEWEDNQ